MPRKYLLEEESKEVGEWEQSVGPPPHQQMVADWETSATFAFNWPLVPAVVEAEWMCYCGAL